jgi:RNA-splicing ligase RtcB
MVKGEKKLVCVHRKGATRAFGPDADGLPPEYSENWSTGPGARVQWGLVHGC